MASAWQSAGPMWTGQQGLTKIRARIREAWRLLLPRVNTEWLRWEVTFCSFKTVSLVSVHSHH